MAWKFDPRNRLRFYCVPLLWALCLSVLLPLQDRRPFSPLVAYENAQQLFLHGYLERSQLAAEMGYARSRTFNREWAAKFHLLEAEAMVWRGLYDDALSILVSDHTILDDTNRTIQKLALESVALTRLQHFSDAGQKLDLAKNLCAREISSSCGEVPRALGILANERGDFADAQSFFFKACISRSTIPTDGLRPLPS